MIVQLRHWHRAIAIAMAVLAPVLLFAAVLARKATPVMTTFPPILDTDILVSGEPLMDRDDLWSTLEIETRLYVAHRVMILELKPRVDLNRPDVLVFWQGEGGDPDDLFQLGALAGTRTCRFLLPAHAALRSGTLSLYSLGHDEELGRCTLPSVEVFAGVITLPGESR